MSDSGQEKQPYDRTKDKRVQLRPVGGSTESGDNSESGHGCSGGGGGSGSGGSGCGGGCRRHDPDGGDKATCQSNKPKRLALELKNKK